MEASPLAANDLPWLQPLRERLRRAAADGRMPHGLLLAGPAGLGKRRLADWLAQLALCEHALATERPCGRCRACRWLGAGTHPDCMEVVPEEDKKLISIDQVRKLVHDLSLKSFAGAGKIAVISPASSLTAQAADSLLKTLEEPTPGSLLILIASQPARLPATVVSRCQKLRCTVPPRATAEAWLRAQGVTAADLPRLLELAGGAPLAALALHEAGFAALDRKLREDLQAMLERTQDPLTVAARWTRYDPGACLAWLEDWTRGLISESFGGRSDPAAERLQKRLESLKLQRLFQYLDRVRTARAALDSSLNWQLMIESLLIPWGDELRPEVEDPIIG